MFLCQSNKYKCYCSYFYSFIYDIFPFLVLYRLSICVSPAIVFMYKINLRYTMPRAQTCVQRKRLRTITTMPSWVQWLCSCAFHSVGTAWSPGHDAHIFHCIKTFLDEYNWCLCLCQGSTNMTVAPFLSIQSCMRQVLLSLPGFHEVYLLHLLFTHL